MSQASTVHPESSVSQALPVEDAPKGNGKKGSKRGPPRSRDPPIPKGPIPVPPPREKQSKTQTPLQNETIPITGWGDVDFTSMHKQAPLQEHVPDAAGYLDLVDHVYLDLWSRRTQQAKHIPRSLFRYFAFCLWWKRVLFVARENGQPLTSDQKAALNALAGVDDLVVPDKIAQHLANMGNFDYNGETYRMVIPNHLSFSEQSNGYSGWLHTDHPQGLRTTPETFWYYHHLPIPGVFVLATQNEYIHAAHPPGAARTDLSHLHPDPVGGSVWRDTDNVTGWSLIEFTRNHTSWNATFENLGWTHNRIPRDMVTDHLISPSTMKWVSDALQNMDNEKTYSVRQVTLSKFGSFNQIGILSHANVKMDDDRQLQVGRYTLSREFCLTARSALPSTQLSAVFCFGYLFSRSAHWNPTDLRFDYYSTSSPFDLSDDQGSVDLPPGYLEHMNRPTDHLSADLRIPRYLTYESQRSTVLTLALTRR